MAATKKKEGKPTAAEFMATLIDKEGDTGGSTMFVYGHSAGDEFFRPKYHIPTGNRILDGIIGEGGFGTGRISEVYGPNRSGKSEIAQRTVASFLSAFEDGLCWYFDQELALDEKKLNANPILKSDRLTIGFCDTIQKLFAKVEKLLKKIKEAKYTIPILIVIDSIAVMESDAQAKKGIGDVQQPGSGAKAVSEALRKIKPIIQGTNAHLMVINQRRKAIGGDPHAEDESPMGEALKFACDYRIHVQQYNQFWFRDADKKEGKPSDGFYVLAHTIKNKRVPPNRKVWLVILYHPKYGGLNEEWSVWRLFHKQLKWFGGSSGNYTFRVGPHKTDDLLRFTRAEWTATYNAQRVRIETRLKEWEDEIMLRNEIDTSESPEDGEDGPPAVTEEEED